MFDYLVVGAGFAGSVLAERLANGSGKKVLICDKRSHIGGNAYDHFNDDGILVHKYGPHIFHTNSEYVFNYLSRFTEWREYYHRVLASVDGLQVPIPINLDTINKLYGLSLTSFELEEFFEKARQPREHIRTSEDVVVNAVGKELYEKFFRNYTRKQWGLDPSELDAAVTSHLIPMIPANRLAIAESGVSARLDVERAAGVGADAVLVGSSVSASSDPTAAVAALTGVARMRRAG